MNNSSYKPLKIKHLYILLALFSFELFSQGLELNDPDAENVNAKNLGVKTEPLLLPSKIDLSMYCPTVGNQRNFGTCVGWSVGYYMHTILEAKRLNITNKKKINALSYSPSFIYNAIKTSDDILCKNGTNMSKAYEFLKTTGNVKYSQQGYPYCNNNKLIKPVETSRILDYSTCFTMVNRLEKNYISAKKALVEGTPVVIGIATTPSIDDLIPPSKWKQILFKILYFFNLDIAQKYDYTLWQPAKSLKGAHAVCVVGYDDNHYDGAFYVVNSYGRNWGDKGYFWIKYTDFEQQARYGFQAFVPPNTDPKNIVMQGDINIDKKMAFTKNIFEGRKTKKSRLLAAYTLNEPQFSESKFTFNAKVDKNAYLYLISSSSVGLEHTVKLFPNIRDQVSAYIGANTKLHIPSDEFDEEHQKYIQNNITIHPPVGIEYWLFLFSEKEIDADKYAQKLSFAKGNFYERVLDVFDTNLVPTHQIIYQRNKMGFILKGGHNGYIVPLLISFEQIAQKNNPHI